jgi:arabinofuranosyltransferase
MIRNSTSPSKGGQNQLLLWSALALLALLLHGLMFKFVIDDAFISFRYAKNLVDGHGLVFNPGYKVEGYSNLSWVLLSALGQKLGIPALLFSRIAGTLSMAGLLLLLPDLATRLLDRGTDQITTARNRHSGIAAQFLVASSGAMACWMLAGLETPLFAFLVVWGWHSALRRRPVLAGVIGLLLVLTRPEGLALGLIYSVWSTLPSGKLNGVGSRRFLRWAGLVIFVVGTAAFFLWRHSYFGYWLPNTYYAKTGDLAGQLKTGGPYTLRFLLFYALPLVAVSVIAIFRRGLNVERTGDTALSLGLVLFWLSYTTVIGGDMLGMFRFMVPILPVMTTLTITVLAGCGWMSRQKIAAMVTIVLALTLLPASFVGKERRLASIHMSQANLGGWILAGDALAAKLPAGSTLALGPAGYIPWITNLESWDFYGLVDPDIAHKEMSFSSGYAGHEKFDAAAILKRKPDIIFIGNVDVTDGPRLGSLVVLDREVSLTSHPDFKVNYMPFSMDIGGGKHLQFFIKRNPTSK